MKIWLDFETASHLNLKEVDTHAYACHPTTIATILTWQYEGSDNIHYWHYKFKDHSELKELFKKVEEGATVVAHNVKFDVAIWHMAFGKQLDFEVPLIKSFECTLLKANMLNYKNSLDNLSNHLGTRTNKYSIEQDLFRKSFTNPDLLSDDEWKEVIRYAIDDTKTLREIDDIIETRMEFTSWQKKCMMSYCITNLKGVSYDIELCNILLEGITKEKETFSEKLEKLTDGAVSKTTESAKLKLWAKKEHDIEIKSLSKLAREQLLKMGLPENLHKCIEILDLVSSNHDGKIRTLLRKFPDGVIRDHLNFCSTKLGRDSSWGFNIQNLPSPKIKKFNDIEYVNEIVTKLKAGEDTGYTWSELIVSLLRSVIIARKGHKFIQIDYSGIEPRFLYHLVKDKKRLDVIKTEGTKKVYKDMSGAIFGLDPSKIKETAKEYTVGKSAILGLGYQMGAKNFTETFLASKPTKEDYKMGLLARNSFLIEFPLVKQAWDKLGTSALQKVTCGKKEITVKLISGRPITYSECRIVEEDMGGWMRTSVVGKVPNSEKDHRIYGGSLVQNFCQGSVSDLMMYITSRAYENDISIVMNVHDENVFEVPEDFDENKILDLYKELPDFMKDIPIDVGTWTANYYGKF